MPARPLPVDWGRRHPCADVRVGRVHVSLGPCGRGTAYVTGLRGAALGAGLGGSRGRGRRKVGLAEGDGGEGRTDLRRVGGPAVDPPEQLAAGNDLHSFRSLGHGVPGVAVSVLRTAVLERGAQGWAPEGQRPWERLPVAMLSPEQRRPPGKGTPLPVWTWPPQSRGPLFCVLAP